jgi:uncharacterized membrane protein YqjE
MNEVRTPHFPERGLAEIIVEIKDEIRSFVDTRLQMFKSELRETISSWKSLMPTAALAFTLLTTAYILFTLAIVALVSVAFWANPYRWFLAFLIIGVVYCFGGAMFAFFAWNKIRNRAIFPKRTLELLREDKLWLQNEARSHL